MIRSIVVTQALFATNVPILLYRWPVGRPPRFLTRLTVRQCDVLQIGRRFGPGRYVLHRIQKNGCEYSKTFRIRGDSSGSCPRRTRGRIRK